MAINGQTVAAGAFTGSISKIFAPSALNITEIAFGVNTTPHTPTTSTVATIAMAAGAYLEGPIIQYKASALTIAYTHDYAQKVSGSLINSGIRNIGHYER